MTGDLPASDKKFLDYLKAGVYFHGRSAIFSCKFLHKEVYNLGIL